MQYKGQAAPALGLGPELASGEGTLSPRWKMATCLGFRVSVSYLVLYAFPFPLDSLPFGNLLAVYWTRLWQIGVPWVGEHLLHLSHKIVFINSGSGDTTFGYVKILCYVILAGIATAVWSFLDRHRLTYARGYQWVHLYVRVLLGATLLSYGAAKLIPTQMPDPSLSWLLTTYGDSAPMNLLWIFMGRSTSYEIAAGLVEMLGGLLLFVPRLATLGALVSTAATANVFLLNMTYDVPVKILSFHLLLMSLWLLIPEAKRLFRFFILNRDVSRKPVNSFFQRSSLDRSVLIVQLLLGAYFAVAGLNGSYHVAKRTGFLAPKPPLYGIWTVDEFNVKGSASTQPADAKRWQRVIFDSSLVVVFQSEGGKGQRFIHQTDLQKKTITLWRRQSWLDKEKGQELQISFDGLPSEVISLDGTLDGNQIHAKLHHIPEPKFLLTTRGFHWINEYPFNGYDE